MGQVIKLNGTVVKGRIDGLNGTGNDFVVTFQRSGPDSTPKKSYSTELTFFDDGYNILKAALIDPADGFNSKVDVEIFDDCCKDSAPVFKGIIQGDAIDWCEPKCFVQAQIIEEVPDLNCIQSTLLADNHNGFQDTEHPKIRYCVELRPQFLHVVIIYFAFILIQAVTLVLASIIVLLLAITSVIAAICAVLDVICAISIGDSTICTAPDCDTSFSSPAALIEFLGDLLNDVVNLILGCGRFHPSPFVRDYIDNVCAKCNLTFVSSILKDAGSVYYNSVLFSAPVEKGRAQNSTDGRIIQGNEPLLTLEQFFLEYLNPTFNAKFEVNNGILRFERKDFFGVGATWINAVSLLEQGRILDEEICFNWLEEQRPAFGRFEYSLDAVDYIGNESNERWKEIVDFNPSGSSLFVGELSRRLPFGLARFRGDAIDETVLDRFLSFAGGAFNSVFGGQFSDNTEILLMNQNTAFQLKLMIWEQESGLDEAKIKNFYSNTFTGGDVISEGAVVNEDERFNYPYWFKEGFNNNLYSKFHYIDDPRETGVKQFDFNFTVTDFTCNEFRTFDFDKIVKVLKNGSLKNGEVNQIEVNFTRRTIRIRGQV